MDKRVYIAIDEGGKIYAIAPVDEELDDSKAWEIASRLEDMYGRYGAHVVSISVDDLKAIAKFVDKAKLFKIYTVHSSGESISFKEEGSEEAEELTTH